MSIVVNIDEKGRLIIPRKIREKTRMSTPGKVLVEAKDKSVELVPVSGALERAKKIAAKKLKGWKEEKHEEEKLLRELVR